MPQKIPVMADNHECPFEIMQGLEQDFPAGNVEVIGRLIEDQKIERAGKQACQYDPAFFSA